MSRRKGLFTIVPFTRQNLLIALFCAIIKDTYSGLDTFVSVPALNLQLNGNALAHHISDQLQTFEGGNSFVTLPVAKTPKKIAC